MRNVKVTLALGLAMLVVVGAVTLTRSPPRVVRVGVPGGTGNSILVSTFANLAVCQRNEVLPAGVSGIRIAIWAFYGARVHVRVYSGSRVLTEGSRGPDWTSDSVTVPVTPVDHPTSGVKLCFGIGPNSQPLILLGVETSPGEAASGAVASTPAAAVSAPARLKGRVGVEYLAASKGSWWSRVSSVVRHMGLGRAYSGRWIALLVAALMLAVAGLAIRLTLRELP